MQTSCNYFETVGDSLSTKTKVLNYGFKPKLDLNAKSGLKPMLRLTLV